MENVQFMRNLINFIYNKNIDQVKTIFENKVPSYMLEHLISKMESYQLEKSDNTSAWIKFIGNFDSENAEIFANYIVSLK